MSAPCMELLPPHQLAAIDAASADDAKWFEAHPQERVRMRPARPFELPGIGAEPYRIGLHIRVTQIVPGIRVREPVIFPAGRA